MFDIGGSSQGGATKGGASQQGASKVDPGRKYETSLPNNMNKWTCIFCLKEISGGVSRLKHHLIGDSTSVIKCPTCPEHVRIELRDYAANKAAERAAQTISCEPVLNDTDDEAVEGEPKQKANSNKRKKRGPLDRYIVFVLASWFARLLDKQIFICSLFFDRFVISTPPDILQGRMDRKHVLGPPDKDLRGKVCAAIARWFYDAGIPFNDVTYDSFKEMTEFIGQYGSSEYFSFNRKSQTLILCCFNTRTSGLLKGALSCRMDGVTQWSRRT